MNDMGALELVALSSWRVLRGVWRMPLRVTPRDGVSSH